MAKFPFKNVFFLMQKRLSSTIPVGEGVGASFTVEYLVSSCGVPLKSAISIAASERVQLMEEKVQRYDSVLNLFRSHGFDHTHIAAMLEKRPELLTGYKVEENLRPKLEYLALNGFSGSHLHHLTVSKPDILSKSLSSAIKPSLEFLRSLLGTEERVLLAVKRCSWLLSNHLEAKLKPNVDLLVKEGVALDDIANYVVNQPKRMLPRVDRLVSALETAKHQLGIQPSDRSFLVAVTGIASVSVPLWEKKIQLLKSFGFSQQQILCILRRAPYCFSLSEETLRIKLDFCLATVKLKLDDVASYPDILSYAIETRSRPRHNVLKLLLSKKLLKGNPKLAPIFTMSEDKFLDKYIINYKKQVPSLSEMYTNDKIEKKIGI